MTMIDGAAHTRWGAVGMLYAEALIGVAALALFVAVAAATATGGRLEVDRRS